MKILQVNKFYSPWIGGIENVVKDLADGLNGKDGIEMEVLACQSRGKGGVEIIDGIKVYRASSFGMLFRMPISLDFFTLYRKLAKQADLIILHHPFPLSFLAYAILGRKKLVVWYHSDIVKQKLIGLLIGPLIKYILRKADLVFVSNKTIISESKLLSLVASKCRVIPYGINISEYALTPELEKESKKIIDRYGKPLVLSVGRLVYYKGFKYLLESFKAIDAYLLIIGDGPLNDELVRQIKDNCLENKVFIIDPVKNLLPYYYACDLFVLASVENSEMFGLVQIEAMACGKPVINTSLPTGVPEVSLDGETGFTVKPRDANALTIAINKILGDSSLREKFSIQSRIRVEEFFSRENFLEANRKFFLEIINK